MLHRLHEDYPITRKSIEPLPLSFLIEPYSRDLPRAERTVVGKGLDQPVGEERAHEVEGGAERRGGVPDVDDTG